MLAHSSLTMHSEANREEVYYKCNTMASNCANLGFIEHELKVIGCLGILLVCMCLRCVKLMPTNFAPLNFPASALGLIPTTTVASACTVAGLSTMCVWT